MSIPTFYHPQLLASDSSLELSPNEAAHASKSRRLRAGQKIRLFNGDGLVADAELSLIERNRVQVAVSACRQLSKPQSNISICTAVPKGDRQRFMIDALCQLGVARITPLNCDYSVTRFSQKMAQKWQRFAVEACKQSQNAWLPQIDPAQDIEMCLSQNEHCQKGFYYADLDGAQRGVSASSPDQPCIFVGPEGGFSEREKDLFQSAGGNPVRLASHILRIETAAIASMALFNQWMLEGRL